MADETPERVALPVQRVVVAGGFVVAVGGDIHAVVAPGWGAVGELGAVGIQLGAAEPVGAVPAGGAHDAGRGRAASRVLLRLTRLGDQLLAKADKSVSVRT